MDEMQTVQPNGMMAVATTREAQQIQASMVIAQKFPRNETQAFNKIIEACKRKALAEKAVYAFPRGGQTVSGPSIRLAETIAKAWGNLEFGVIELENKPSFGNVFGESTVMSYCIDLETNTRSSKVFTVRHKRDKSVTEKNGSKKKIMVPLTDERDIYEMVANYGARRLRSCILNVIPADIVESAVEQCGETLKKEEGPLIDRIRAMTVAFGDIGVSQEMIEKRIAHKIDVTSAAELVQLRQIYTSIKDGFADRTQYFEFATIDVEEPGEPKEEVKSKSIKDITPPATSEIPNMAPEMLKTTQAKTPEVVAPAPDPSIERRTQLGRDVTTMSKSLGLGTKELQMIADENFKKKPSQLTVDELEKFRDLLVMRLEKRNPNV